MKLSYKLILGFALLAIGLLIGVGAWNSIQYFQGGLQHKVPDYLLKYLVLGVFTMTVGTTIVAPSLWKRLVGNIGDD
jgi:predicted histidine transporter YuiF (NhaC family)